MYFTGTYVHRYVCMHTCNTYVCMYMYLRNIYISISTIQNVLWENLNGGCCFKQSSECMSRSVLVSDYYNRFAFCTHLSLEAGTFIIGDKHIRYQEQTCSLCRGNNCLWHLPLIVTVCNTCLHLRTYLFAAKSKHMRANAFTPRFTSSDECIYIPPGMNAINLL